MTCKYVTLFICIFAKITLFSMDVDAFRDEKIDACIQLSFVAEINPSHKQTYNSSNARLALLVGKGILETDDSSLNYTYDNDKHTLTENIAKNFIGDAYHTDGWAAQHRKPDNACLDALQLLHKKDMTQEKWWDTQAHDQNGCGSVMRSYPFGIAFHTTPQLAGTLAAYQSSITHANSAAKAACAAMAHAIARSINHQNMQESIIDSIVNTMAFAAEQYDAITARKIREAKDKCNRLITQYTIAKIFSEASDKTTILDEKKKITRADDAIAMAVYFFVLSHYCNSKHELIQIIQESSLYMCDTGNCACLVGPLLGAYYGKKAVDDKKDSIITYVEKNDIHTYPTHTYRKNLTTSPLTLDRSIKTGLFVLFILHFLIYYQ